MRVQLFPMTLFILFENVSFIIISRQKKQAVYALSIFICVDETMDEID